MSSDLHDLLAKSEKGHVMSLLGTWNSLSHQLSLAVIWVSTILEEGRRVMDLIRKRYNSVPTISSDI